MSREKRVTGIRRLFSFPASPRRVQREVDDEIRFHIETRVAELMAEGKPLTTAREIAGREFGDVAEARSELARVDRRRLTRERRQSAFETLGQDLGYSARALRNQPMFSAVVVIVLALGIGANVTMFGVIDRLLLRPPAHVTDPQRVVIMGLARATDAGGRMQRVLSYPLYLDMQTAKDAFERVAAYSSVDLAIGRGRDARELSGMRVSASYFPTLGVRPAAGRFMLPEEDGNPVAPRVAVLGYSFWQRQFQASPSAIGRTLTIGADAYTVIGVAPDGFRGVSTTPIDVWIPFTTDITPKEYENWLRGRQAYWLFVVGRLRPGVTRETASTVATAMLRAGDARSPDASSFAAEQRQIRLVSVLPREAKANTDDAKVAVLLGAVSVLVLLIACANVANLQLARAIARGREVAVRIALGIDRGRLVRQLVSETVLLAVAAGFAAMLVTIWGGGVVRRLILSSDIVADRPIDIRLVAYTALAAIVAGILSGLIPALQSSRPDLADNLRAGTRSSGPARSLTRSSLLVMQAALTVVFLVGTALFVRSLRRVEAMPLGMEPDHVLVVSARTTGLRYTDQERAALYTRLEGVARATPGIESAALAVGLPFSTSWAERVTVPGRDSLPVTDDGGPYFNAVSPDFFRTMGMRIVRGRGFTEAEAASASRVAIINETIAKLWWPNEDPVGRCMRIGDDTMPCAQIIGIAENSRRQSLMEQSAVQFFVPMAQRPAWVDSRVLFVRPRGDAVQSVEMLRRALQAGVPDAPFLQVRPLSDLVSPQMRAWRLGATMFGAFGLLAVIVAALGLYSVLAYDVSRRIREMGIRVALGAARVDIGRMVISRALRVAAIGAGVGFAIAIAAGPAVAPLLFQTSPREPVAFLGAAAVLFTVAVLSAVVPTRRASRVDPIVALRSE